MDITGPDGAVTHGADQDWFPDLWQQRAGCGPTAAAVILSYLARTRPELAPLYPEGAMDRASFTGLMCRVWEHVTPVSHGLNRPEQMAEGMASFAAARGLTLTPGLFVFPSARTKRPPYEQVEAFVRRALERDCPVAFLNLHNGRVKELDYWHWVTITALEDTTAVILDSGSALRIDLRLWYETTKRRAALWPPWGTRHEVFSVLGAVRQPPGLCPHGCGQVEGQAQPLAGTREGLLLRSPAGRHAGALLGMWTFRHKTRHWYFRYGLPALLLVQLALGTWIAIRVF